MCVEVRAVGNDSKLTRSRIGVGNLHQTKLRMGKGLPDDTRFNIGESKPTQAIPEKGRGKLKWPKLLRGLMLF